MKYPKLPEMPTKRISVPHLEKGLRHADSGIRHCRNVWYQNGALHTRPAFRHEVEDFFYQPDSYMYIQEQPKATGVFIKTEYGEGEIFIIPDTDDYYSNVNYRFFAVTAQGNIKSLDYINFGRVTDDCFYIPVRHLIYSANPTIGCGIYFFVSRKDETESEFFEMFELSEDHSKWLRLQSSDAYVPTVYINGRGNNYYIAEQYGVSYTNAPIYLEKQNLLNSFFYAYYSSDGYSTTFRLPYFNLDSSIIRCRIYPKPDSFFEWVINSNQTESTILFAGEYITMKCDREAGTVQFLKENIGFPIMRFPLFGENNIRFYTSKTVPDGIERIAGGGFAVKHHSDIYIGGSVVAPNRLYGARYTNPLYFPTDNEIAVGDTCSTVNAACLRGDDLLLFQEEKITALSISKGSAYVKKEFSPAAGMSYYHKNISRLTEEVSGVGCKKDSVLCSYKGALLWYDSQNRVYILHRGSLQTSVISAPIEAATTQCPPANAAMILNGYYLMFCDNQIFALRLDSVLNEKNENAVWYYWELPEKINCCFAVSGEHQFLFAVTKDLHAIYLLRLTTGMDCFCNSNRQLEELELQASLSFHPLDCNNPYLHKKVNALFLTASGNGQLSVSCGMQKHFRLSSYEESPSIQVMHPHLIGVRTIPLEIELTADSAITDISLHYQPLGEVK